jgi:dihydrofolate reductase
VAISVDGFISGPNDDISGFVADGDGVVKYLTDLQAFDTVIMGRKTYEFGYKFGLEPGQPAYQHMKHYVFSSTLTFESQHEAVEVVDINLAQVDRIRSQSGGDIYLCGGGQLAGWLLDHHRIDFLKIKLNPFVQGMGTRLFGDSQTFYRLELLDSEQFEHGLQIITYNVLY